MSDMSLFMHGIGLEAFDDSADKVVLEQEVVDVSELVILDNEAATNEAAVTEQSKRVAVLTEARVFGESKRNELDEKVAVELQRRVMEVVGDSRATLIVGSVESYNGSIGESILNASLESIGGMIQTAIATLVRLIRTGISIFMRFITSARIVLASTKSNLSKLREAIKKSKNWRTESIGITGDDISKVKTKYEGNVFDTTLIQTDMTGGSSEVPVTLLQTPTTLSARHAMSLCFGESGGLRFPQPFVPALKATVGEYESMVIGSTTGMRDYFRAVMSLIKDSADMKDDDERFKASDALTLDKFLPISKMTMSRGGNEFSATFVSKQMMGNVELSLHAPLGVVMQDYKRTDTMRVGHGIGSIDLSLATSDIHSSKASIRGIAIKPLTEQEANQAAALVAGLLDEVTGSDLNDKAHLLGKESDELAARVLPRLSDTGNINNFKASMVQAMSTLSSLTTNLPRNSVGYVNSLSNAVTAYIRISAGV
ncbi:hypothetical protein pEaSNUABM37_00336 [Erwinia phage pEa_SNUABM_37]|nr:hypothetical protein pEaSNUABM37_00336 [Erwinia phage pEa_SNUABM_37]QXO10804.1 hypothetical protein pEaSNUABM48_00336 [Erwinia phage pEa_SNUABM_48]